ncbi:Tad domain-containing protein [Nocardioides sp.]|uniref:Tad domain-containing protein n=1 Tax=Nocardioides sp. TaxID=35761 RepID=UPI002C3DF9E7|nr:Tad domain-containing protein [Nocardioides sp.]HXH80280.1 Tad domain-containing protein [Nocardioides sp.]
MKRRDERGSTIPLILGLATVLLMGIALVINASSAYLQRQSLDTLADGAALRGADLGASGVYGEGLTQDRLLQESGAVRKVVIAYLASVGADRTYPGLEVQARVNVVDRSVTVILSAPVKLPLHLPGTPTRPVVTATSTAAVTLEE